MCDQDFQEDLKKYTRRDVGVLAAAVGVAAMLPRASNAVDVKERDVNIKTPDGECDAYFVAPSSGASAAVLVWPDIFGLRPAFRQMGKRLAESGYAVLVVNPFYRQKKAPTAANGASTPIAEVMPQMQALTPATNIDRREGVHRVARPAVAGRQEQEDRHHRLLHGRVHRDAHGGGRAEPRGRRRDVPRCRVGYEGAGQPASLDPADEGAVPRSRSPRTTTCALPTTRTC